MFEADRQTVRRIWSQALHSIESGDPTMSVISGLTNKFQPKKYNRDELKEKITVVSFRKRQNIRSLASAVGVSKGTISNLKQENTVRRVTSTLKPLLTDENMLERVEHCARSVDAATLPFRSILCDVHMDEKWFYITADKR